MPYASNHHSTARYNQIPPHSYYFVTDVSSMRVGGVSVNGRMAVRPIPGNDELLSSRCLGLWIGFRTEIKLGLA
jgi:hypothetical protein